MASWMVSFLTFILLAGSLANAGSKRRRSAAGPLQFQFSFLQSVDNRLEEGLDGRMHSGHQDADGDVHNAPATYDQLMKNWKGGGGGGRHSVVDTNGKRVRGTKREGGQNIDLKPLRPFPLNYQTEQDLQAIRKELEEVGNFDTSRLIDGINQLLAQQHLGQTRASSTNGDQQECDEGEKFINEIHTLFENFGQPPGLQQFLETLGHFFRALHTFNPKLATKLQNVFVSADGSAGSILENFVRGRPISAIRNTLKAAETLSDVELEILYAILVDVKSVTVDESIRQVLDNVLLVFNTLSSNKDMIKTVLRILTLFQNLKNDEKTTHSLAVLLPVLSNFTYSPQLILALEKLSAVPTVSRAFEFVEVLLGNIGTISLGSIDAMRVISNLQSALTAVNDTSEFLRTIICITQTQKFNVADTMRFISQLFSTNGTNNPESDRILLIMNNTLTGLTRNLDVVHIFLHLSRSPMVIETFEDLKILLTNVGELNPDLTRAIISMTESLAHVLMNQQLVQAIHAVSKSPDAIRVLDVVGAMFKNVSVSGTFSAKFDIVKKLIAFFVNNSALFETIKNTGFTMSDKQVFELATQLLKDLNLTNPDGVTFVLMMRNVLDDLAQNTDVKETFVNFARIPSEENAMQFVMQILSSRKSLTATASRAVLAVKQTFGVLAHSPEFVETLVNLTHSPTLSSAVNVLASWLTTDGDHVVSSGMMLLQAAILTMIDNEDLVKSLQTYNEHLQHVNALRVLKLLYHNLNRTMSDVEQAILTVENSLNYLYIDSAAYKVFELLVNNPTFFRIVHDVASDSSFTTVFSLMAASTDFTRVLLLITEDSTLKQAVGIFRDIVATFSDSSYAAEALRLVVSILIAISDQTEVQTTVSAIRELVLTIKDEKESNPALVKIQLALENLLRLLNATDIISVGESIATTTATERSAGVPSSITGTFTTLSPPTITANSALGISTPAFSSDIQTAYHLNASATSQSDHSFSSVSEMFPSLVQSAHLYTQSASVGTYSSFRYMSAGGSQYFTQQFDNTPTPALSQSHTDGVIVISSVTVTPWVSPTSPPPSTTTVSLKTSTPSLSRTSVTRTSIETVFSSASPSSGNVSAEMTTTISTSSTAFFVDSITPGFTPTITVANNPKSSLSIATSTILSGSSVTNIRSEKLTEATELFTSSVTFATSSSPTFVDSTAISSGHKSVSTTAYMLQTSSALTHNDSPSYFTSLPITTGVLQTSATQTLETTSNVIVIHSTFSSSPVSTTSPNIIYTTLVSGSSSSVTSTEPLSSVASSLEVKPTSTQRFGASSRMAALKSSSSTTTTVDSSSLEVAPTLAQIVWSSSGSIPLTTSSSRTTPPITEIQNAAASFTAHRLLVMTVLVAWASCKYFM